MSSLPRISPQWSDYELLDSGDGAKCERFGSVVLVRPELQALWSKNDSKQHWSSAPAIFSRRGEDGDWHVREQPPTPWEVVWENLRFGLELTSFKHTGLFPEQAANWQYIRENLKAGQRVLNLFGYTGGATLAAASVGAEVVHIDASKPAITWGKENLKRSGLADASVRWIAEDVMTFVEREARREHVYDMVVMDPPAFGHGPAGEIWKFERDLPLLLANCAPLLSPEYGCIIVNAYSLGFPALTIEQTVRATLPFVRNVETLELTLRESTPRAFELPAGIVVRATW